MPLFSRRSILPCSMEVVTPLLVMLVLPVQCLQQLVGRIAGVPCFDLVDTPMVELVVVVGHSGTLVGVLEAAPLLAGKMEVQLGCLVELEVLKRMLDSVLLSLTEPRVKL